MAKSSLKDDILAGIAEKEAHVVASGKSAVIYDDTLPYVAITPDQFSWAGELIFGRNWKTEMSEILDLKDSSRVREIMREQRPIPKHVGAKVLATIKSRIEELTELAEEIEAGPSKQV